MLRNAENSCKLRCCQNIAMESEWLADLGVGHRPHLMHGTHVLDLMHYFGGAAVAAPEFPRQRSPTLGGGGTNLSLCQLFPENCMKMKKN